MTVEDACVKSGPQISFFFFRLVTKFLCLFCSTHAFMLLSHVLRLFLREELVGS